MLLISWIPFVCLLSSSPSCVNIQRITQVDRYVYGSSIDFNNTYCNLVHFNLNEIEMISPFLHIYNANLANILADSFKWKIQYEADGSCFPENLRDEYKYFSNLITDYIKLNVEEKVIRLGLHFGGYYNTSILYNKLNLLPLCVGKYLSGFQTQTQNQTLLDSNCPPVVTVYSHRRVVI